MTSVTHHTAAYRLWDESQSNKSYSSTDITTILSPYILQQIHWYKVRLMTKQVTND